MDLPNPILHRLESVSLIDGVCEDDGDAPFVKCWGDVFKLLLSCRIPNLHLDFVFIDLHGFYFEVDSDGGCVRWPEGVVTKSKKNVGFAHSTISDNYCLDSEIAVMLFSRFHRYSENLTNGL